LHGAVSGAMVKGVKSITTMKITHEQLTEITEVIEDTVEYACDKELLSGELVWTVVESLAIAKLAEIRGELAAA
jgi:hypothetical protein